MLGLRHSPACGAALSDRRAGEPVRLPADRAGHGVGLDACRSGSPPRSARSPSSRRRLLTSFHHPLPWFHHSNLLLPFPYVMGVWAAVVSGILFIGFYSWRTAEEARRMARGAGRRRDGAGARAEAVGARRARRGGGARARHAARDHRRRHQGADARRQAERPALRGLVLLRAQAERCRHILAELAGARRAASTSSCRGCP